MALLLLIGNAMANSADPDQKPRSMASELNLHFLQRSICETLSVNGVRVAL